MTASKTVLITGCSDGGLGSALAVAFHAQGYHVYATSRKTSKMTALSSLPNITLLRLDVSIDSDISAAVEAIKRSKINNGKLDIVINNAGRNYFMPVLDIDIDEAKEIYETNLWGPIRVMKAFAPFLVEARGKMINTTSIAGYVNVPWMGLYAASKRSLEIMTETLRLELYPFGVIVLSIVTGAVQSNGQTYFEDFKLPENSMYKSIEGIIGDRARGGDGGKRQPTEEYAKSVVENIIAGKTGKLWKGVGAGGVKFATTWLPQSVMDSSVSKGTGVDQLSGSKAKDV